MNITTDKSGKASNPPIWSLISAWAIGIGGCDMLGWLAFHYDGPFRLAAGIVMLLTGITVWLKWYRSKIDLHGGDSTGAAT